MEGVELGHDVDAELGGVEQEQFAAWGEGYYSKERQAYLAYGLRSDSWMLFWRVSKFTVPFSPTIGANLITITLKLNSPSFTVSPGCAISPGNPSLAPCVRRARS